MPNVVYAKENMALARFQTWVAESPHTQRKELRGALHVAAHMSQLPYEHAGYVNTGCAYTDNIFSDPTATIQIRDSNFTSYIFTTIVWIQGSIKLE